MTDFQQGIISLTRAAVTGERTELPDGFSLERIDAFAKKHQISSILLCGIHTAGLDLTHPAVRKLYTRSVSELVVSEKQLSDISEVRSLFLKNGISFISLKGAVLKSLYPKPEMRTMGDIDLLIKIDEYKRIKSILIENGYTEIEESDHEIAWKSPRGCYLELHKALMPSYHNVYYSYFGDGWSFAERSEDSSEYFFTGEVYFLYVFTHFAKHYRSGGIGIKHLIDLWLYKKHHDKLDFNFIENELQKLNLLEFYKNICRVEDVWFNCAESDEITDIITSTIIKSGAYGTHEARVNAENLRISKSENKDVSKFKIFMRKVFPSRSVLEVKYKFLGKFGLLLPVAWVIRWFNAVFCKRDNIKRHAEDIKSSNREKVLDLEKELAFVGLKYETKEKL